MGKGPGHLRLRRNPRDEFTQLYSENFELVYNYVRYRMPGDSAAEDVVSEAFLKAARAFDRFDPTRSKFSTWVIAIAKNCMISYYRKPSSAPLEAIPPTLVAVTDDEQDSFADAQLAEHLLTLLSDEERELVFMKYYREMRNKEIANELGINASTVSTKLSRAMAKMRAAAERV